MTRALSNDLRERVVAAVVGGESCRAVASRFGVAVSSVVKWSQRYRATGSVAPGKMGGHRKRVLEPHRAFIVERINQTPASDAASAEGRVGCARGHGLAQCGLAVPAARGPALQKKRCSPLSRPAPTSLAGASAGDRGRVASIRGVWSSSTRPGSRPTWPRCAAGGPRASACAASLRTATGAR